MSGGEDRRVGRVLAAVAEVPPGAVQITGPGALARALRRRLPAPAREGLAPQAIIETTGSGPELAAACQAVADGGVVVLAGGAGPAVDIDLYRDVHRRGLVLVGVAVGEEEAADAAGAAPPAGTASDAG